MRIVYFALEIYSREFKPFRHIAASLVRTDSADLTVVGSKRVLNLAARWGLLPRGVWHIKSAQAYTGPMLNRLRERGFEIIMQDAESVVTFDTQDRFDPFSVSADNLKNISKILTVTADEQKRLEGYVANTEARRPEILRAGYFRFAHLVKGAEINHESTKEQVRHLRETYGNGYIVFCSTTSRFHEFAYTTSEVALDLEKQGLLPSHIADLVQWSKYYQYVLVSFLETLRLLRLSGESPTVVFRAHPSEDRSFLEKLLCEFDNVVLNTEGDFHELALGASAVISNGSTTLVEAAALGTPAIALIPHAGYEIEEILVENISSAVSRVCRSPAELHDTLRQLSTYRESVEFEAKMLNARTELGLDLLTDKNLSALYSTSSASGRSINRLGMVLIRSACEICALAIRLRDYFFRSRLSRYSARKFSAGEATANSEFKNGEYAPPSAVGKWSRTVFFFRARWH